MEKKKVDKFGRTIDHDYDGCRNRKCHYLTQCEEKAPEHCIHGKVYPGLEGATFKPDPTRTLTLVALHGKRVLCPHDKKGTELVNSKTDEQIHAKGERIRAKQSERLKIRQKKRVLEIKQACKTKEGKLGLLRPYAALAKSIWSFKEFTAGAKKLDQYEVDTLGTINQKWAGDNGHRIFFDRLKGNERPEEPKEKEITDEQKKEILRPYYQEAKKAKTFKDFVKATSEQNFMRLNPLGVHRVNPKWEGAKGYEDFFNSVKKKCGR